MWRSASGRIAESETQWTMLADKTDDTFLSFDITDYREGWYLIPPGKHLPWS